MTASGLPSYLHDPVLERFFGSVEIPRLKPRPGEVARGSGGAGRGGRRFSSRGSGRGSGGGVMGLLHNAFLTQQAVVKIVPHGGVRSIGRLGGQLAYISRDGGLALERGDTGEVCVGVDACREVQKDWAQDWAGMDPRTRFYSYHVIVSYPAGTDRDAARAASLRFADRLCGGEFGDRYKYVLAHHGDTANQHTHIVISRAGEVGKTLHLSRDGIDIQTLRELHAETAHEVGLVLNATSRFSRGVDQRPIALGRFHAERAGRGISRRSGARTTGHPFYGASRRIPLVGTVLQQARFTRAADYLRLARSFKDLPLLRDALSRERFGWRAVQADLHGFCETAVMRAAEVLVRNGDLKEGIGRMSKVTAEMSAERTAAIEAEVEAINDDIRVFFSGMEKKLAGLGDEEKRTQGEIALSHLLKGYEPLMTKETRGLFSAQLDRDESEVERDDRDPARQRRAAVRDASDPSQTAPLEEKDRSKPDPRSLAANGVLDAADKDVAARFEQIGMNGALALSRIRNGADVDRETRRKWFERDVAAYANANSLSDAQARKMVEAAYREAAEIYRDARSEIRGINRSFAQSQELGLSVSPPADQQTREQAEQSRSPAAPAAPSIDLKKGVRGTIIASSETLYDPKDKDSLSPYLDLKIKGYINPKRIWGVALPDLLEKHSLKVGDTATFVQNGKETVTVSKADPETGELRKRDVQRNRWEARDFDRAIDRAASQPLPEQQRKASPEQDGVTPQARQPLDLEKGVRATIVAVGESLTNPNDKESMSPHMDLKIEGYDNPKRVWGLALPDLLNRYNLKAGDTATFVQKGKETVTMSKADPETGEVERFNVERFRWEAREFDRAIDRDPEVIERRRQERAEWAKGDRSRGR